MEQWNNVEIEGDEECVTMELEIVWVKNQRYTKRKVIFFQKRKKKKRRKKGGELYANKHNGKKREWVYELREPGSTLSGLNEVG